MLSQVHQNSVHAFAIVLAVFLAAMAVGAALGTFIAKRRPSVWLPLERIWSIHLASTGISELEFRADWTALHRMNTLVHLDAVPAVR